MKAKTSDAKVHFASLMDICHLKNAELEAKHAKYKSQIVLQGDIVKDDSGSYAVFTEQRSSTSKMTAAKIMDIISRLFGCAKQAADAISTYTQLKMEDAHKLLSKIGVSKHLDSSTTTQMAWIMVQYGRPSRSSWTESAVILWQDHYGKDNLRKFFWNMTGRKFQIGNVSWYIVEKRLFSSVYVDDIKLAGKKQNLDPMWKLPNKEIDLGEPTSFLDHAYLGCTQRQCQTSKDTVVDNYRTMFERVSAGENREITIPSKSSYFFMVLWYGGWRKAMCGTILWVGKEDDTTTLQSINSMHRSPPLQGRRIEICWRIVTSMLSNCSEMFILGTNCKIWYFMVSEWACKIHNKMNQSLWQTLES